MPAENQTVTPSFNISPPHNPSIKPYLLVQAGKQGISLIALDADSNTFITVQVYHFAKHLSYSNIAEEINILLSADNLLQQHFKKIFITWCFDENILIPQQYFDSSTAAAMLQLVYGDASACTVQTELVLTQNLYVAYNIPAVVKSVFNNWFPFAIQTHQAAALINIDKEQKDVLYCNFYPNHLTVLLRRGGQLQVIQNFEYNTPEDAVYHLLNVCQSFETAAIQTGLTVSGTIDADSSLYTELHKYFLEITFTKLPDNFSYTAAINNYPPHYFSHLFAIASCVL